MSDIKTFDHLPTEIIVCIFGYLSAADNFRSFFDYNNRLRKIVKHYVTYSREVLKKDIKRFSQLHSWYKHLNFVDDGATFYLIPRKGEQMRYSFDPRISDYFGIHWHFCRRHPVPIADKRIQQIIHEYPIKLNTYFHPHGTPMTKGFTDFVRRQYPQQFEAMTSTLSTDLHERFFIQMTESMIDDFSIHLDYISKNEPKRLNKIIQEAAHHIWKELQKLEDVNILEIHYN